MAKLFDQVQPGDLIKAQFVNSIVAEIESLEVRVSQLESAAGAGSGVVIISLSPSGPLHMGDELTVNGQNFGIPSSNVIMIDGSRVDTFKPGSNDRRLIFDIPAVQGVTSQGKVVTLNLSNSNGFAAVSFFLLPSQPSIPTGSLLVSLSQPPPDLLLLAGRNYDFVFTINAITTMDETFSLTPTADLAWPVAVAPAEIFIPKGDPPNGTNRDVRVIVTIPIGTPATTTAQLSLSVASKRNPLNLSRTSGNIRITVGSAPPAPQDKIKLSFNTVFQPGNAAAGVVLIPATGNLIRVDFTAIIKDPGAYTVNPPTIQNATGWIARVMGSTTINTPNANANVLITLGVSAQLGASSTNLVLRVTSAADSTIFGEFSQPIRAV